jgi:hypothetical protein
MLPVWCSFLKLQALNSRPPSCLRGRCISHPLECNTFHSL